MGLRDMIHWETHDAEPIQWQGMTVTPQSQAVIVRLPLPTPNAAASFVWNRPVAILVNKNNQITRFPVYNLNRVMIFLFFGIMTALFVLVWLISEIAGLLTRRSNL